MSKITISEAAAILGKDKKTLMRWDEASIFKAEREPVSKVRLYEKAVVEKVARWFDMRRRHKEHIKKLSAIQARIHKFLPLKPLVPGEKPKGLTVQEAKEMKEAFDDKRKWYEEEKKFDQEYMEFREDYYGRLEE